MSKKNTKKNNKKDEPRTLGDVMETIPLGEQFNNRVEDLERQLDNDLSAQLADVPSSQISRGDKRKLYDSDEHDSSSSGEDKQELAVDRSGTDGTIINLIDGSQVLYDRIPMAIPRCYCGVRMRAGKCTQGENRGKLFWTCAKNDKNARCSGFGWITSPAMQAWLLNYPKDAAYNAYAQLHADEKAPGQKRKATRIIRVNAY